MKYQDAMTMFGVSETVARVYEALEVVAAGDDENGYVLLWYIDALVGPIEQLESYARYSNGRDGWANMMDPATVVADAIDWLAQFVGTVTSGIAATADKRAALTGHSSWQRGGKAAMLSAVKATLTGTKRVTLVERWQGHVWQIVLWTYAAETPDPAATTAAALSQKPGGDVFVGVNVIPGMTWYDASRQFATWSAFAAAFPSWGAAAVAVPSY